MATFVIVAVAIVAAVTAGYRPLDSEQAARLKSWKKGDQNMWQLSGQFEGDMILEKGQRNGLVKEKYRWPNNEIPYGFASVVSDEQQLEIETALEQYTSYTCVTTRPRNDTDVDYIFVTNYNSGCWSYVGRQGGRQMLNLQEVGCNSAGTIIHEFLHAFGFYHMQSATERDDYVTIVWENIMDGMEPNFDVYSNKTVTMFGEEYDYGSVMHYDAYAFTSNGEATIIPKDPNAEIGQRDGLSDIDIAKLNKMYECIK